MNVLSLLDQELKDKNWNEQEKARYLYLRSCQIFSYDQRYLFWDQIPNGISFRDNIRNASFSLEDLQTNLVICSTCIRSVIALLFSEILNKDVKVLSKGEHVFGSFFSNNQEILLDSTDYYDLFRVKVGMSTHGYRPISNLKNFVFQNELKEIDLKIQYIEENYYDTFLKVEIYHKLRNFLFSMSAFSLKDQLLYKMELLQSFYQNLYFSTFSDASQCITYFIHQIFGLDDWRVVVSPLFLINSIEDWDFVTIYSLMIGKEVFYYVLREEENRFLFEKIEREEVAHYKHHMQGISKSLIPFH